MMNISKENKTKNLINRVNNFLDKIKKNGFRGVKVQRIEKESIWHPEYAIFILEFNIPLTGFMSFTEPDCEYCKPAYFDEDQLNNEFADHVAKQFPECEVRVSYRGKEFEIVGKNNKAFYDRYEEQLEEEYMKHHEHAVWIPEDYE